MPRLPRQWVSGGIYHLTVRGNNREPIFLDDADYQQYLLELRRCRDQLPYQLLAFALMPNHVHLVFEALPETSLSDVMHRIGKNYANYFNGRHGRVGHLYQGRFYSSFVNREPYLLEVTRYVHLNPVRARLCYRPADYLWSSYAAYVAPASDPLKLSGWLNRNRILSLFGSVPLEQRRQYQEFVEQLADREEEMRSWVYKLHRSKLIPPARWLKKVPGTFSAL